MLFRAAHGICRFGVWFGGALLVAATLLIGFEVLARRFFLYSVPGVDELGGYALAIGSAWAFAFALLHRLHIRIDSLYVVLPSPVRAILDLVGLASFIAVMAVVTWYGWGVMSQSIAVGARSMTRLETPVWIPQAVWLAGLALFLLVGLLMLVRGILALARGDLATISRMIGSRSAQEEMEEELAEATRAAEDVRRQP